MTVHRLVHGASAVSTPRSRRTPPGAARSRWTRPGWGPRAPRSYGRAVARPGAPTRSPAQSPAMPSAGPRYWRRLQCLQRPGQPVGAVRLRGTRIGIEPDQHPHQRGGRPNQGQPPETCRSRLGHHDQLAMTAGQVRTFMASTPARASTSNTVRNPVLATRSGGRPATV